MYIRDCARATEQHDVVPRTRKRTQSSEAPTRVHVPSTQAAPWLANLHRNYLADDCAGMQHGVNMESVSVRAFEPGVTH